HLLHGGIANFFRRPLAPREHDCLVALGGNRSLEVGDLAVGNVVAPTLDNAKRSPLQESLRHVRSHVDVLLFAVGLARNDISIDVAHGATAPDRSPMPTDSRVTISAD